MTPLNQSPDAMICWAASAAGAIPLAVAAVASQAKPGKSRWPARLDLLQSLSGLLLALFLMSTWLSCRPS